MISYSIKQHVNIPHQWLFSNTLFHGHGVDLEISLSFSHRPISNANFAIVWVTQPCPIKKMRRDIYIIIFLHFLES